MRALVTGATGFVGANLVRRLITDGYQVHALVRRPTGNWRVNEINEHLILHEADISDRGAVSTVVDAAAPEVVFHLANAGLYGGVAASDEDYATEYLAPIISCKIVAGLDEAIAHINRYSSQHTDTIVTENYSNALRFLREVDSASVMVNASTRFADGFEFGLGAEIGISTDKFHARGPVGLEGLTSQKWIVLGNGEVRA